MFCPMEKQLFVIDGRFITIMKSSENVQRRIEPKFTKGLHGKICKNVYVAKFICKLFTCQKYTNGLHGKKYS